LLKYSPKQQKYQLWSESEGLVSDLVRSVNVDNFGEIVLCQIPSVNSVTAIAIMKEIHTINNLMDAIQTNPNCLEKIVTENNRKISKTCIKNIILFLQRKIE
jgi:hypothetical protein